MHDLAAQLRQIADCLDVSTEPAPNENGDNIRSLKPVDSDLDFGTIAHEIYQNRRLREQSFGITGLFAEPAWDILLDLVISERKFRRVSVTSACIASCVPHTTALRWLSILEDHGIVQRTRDPADTRRVYIELTNLGRKKVYSALAGRRSSKLGALNPVYRSFATS